MKKILSVLLTALILVGSTTSVFAQPPYDSDTITVSVPVKVTASYTGSSTAGDTQFTFTATTQNGNSLGNGVTFTTDYVTLANGHYTVTGYITFTLTSSDAAMSLLQNGISFRMNVGNRSGWTYDTTTYTLKFQFVEDTAEANKYEIEYVSVNNGVWQNYSGTGWTLNFTNYYKSGSTVTVTQSQVGCAGVYDKNCDGVVTCAERYGTGWTWSTVSNGCVFTGTTSPVDPPVAVVEEETTQTIEVSVGDTTISVDQSTTGHGNNVSSIIVIIPETGVN